MEHQEIWRIAKRHPNFKVSNKGKIISLLTDEPAEEIVTKNMKRHVYLGARGDLRQWFDLDKILANNFTPVELQIE